MATYNNFPEEGRPPDSPSNRKYKERKHFQPRNNSWSHPNSLIYPNGGDNVVNNNLLGLDVNRNGQPEECYGKKSQSLKNKLFCIKKPLEENKRKSLNILNVNALGDNSSSASKRVCDNDPSCSTGKDRNRNSFHQDVEEALSSLLWQPYEYQNKEKPPPSSSCSSCGSSLTFSDLDDPPNKGPLHSSQENTDLNPRTEMVNNLKPASHQCRLGNWSRDALSCRATSRLNSQASLLELVDGGTATCLGDSASDCDVFPCKNGDMQLEVRASDASAPPNNVLNIATGNDGLIRSQNVTLFQNQRPLSSANVVGLPENPRRASVPSAAQLRGSNVVFPNHPRNVSEPFRYNQPNVVPVVHQRSGSQVEQAAITHLRSASVPKQMSGTAAALPNHQRINSDGKKITAPPLNVSNVNVNFYRAVPVNVVSAVPTIQCLNTLDEGNNVSNVHIMPLSTTPCTSAAATGTTQVTVHNTQTPTHTVNVVQRETRAPPTRTFTSTEAQTDEISVCPPPPTEAPDREQRRKERRERRHQRRTNGTTHRHTVDSGTQANTLHNQNDRLPDLLNSHMPPPYSPLPTNVPPPNVVIPNPMMVPQPHPHGTILQSVVPTNNVVPSGLVAFPPPQVVGGQVPLVQGNGPVAVPVPPPSGFRFPFPAGGFRR
jgi:hypothetical protein